MIIQLACTVLHAIALSHKSKQEEEKEKTVCIQDALSAKMTLLLETKYINK